jgi:hypothetical protein
MPERDAFGREIGGDPLADLGWSTSGTPAPPTPEAITPVAQPRPPVMATPPQQQQFHAPPQPRYQGRRRRGPGAFIFIVVLISVAVALAGGLFSFGQIAGDAVDGLEGAIRDAVPTVTAAPPQGNEAGSLLRAKDLKAALAKLPPGDIHMIRVAPERIDVQISDGGKMQLVQVRADGGVTTVTTPAPSVGDPVKVNSAAPARIVRTASRRAGRDPADVSYLVLARFGTKSEWQLFFSDGLHFSASANGKKVRRVG